MMTTLAVHKINIPRKWRKQADRKATWWIVGLPEKDCGMTRCGPYHSYAEARDDCDGMARFFAVEEKKHVQKNH